MRESPEIAGPWAATSQGTAKADKGNDNKNEDKQPIFGENGRVIIDDLGKRERLDGIEIVVSRNAIDVESRQGGNINGIREKGSPLGSPNRDGIGFVSKVV